MVLQLLLLPRDLPGEDSGSWVHVVVGFGIPGTRAEKQQQRSCNSDSLRPRGQVDAERASARFLYGNYLIIHILAYQPEAAVCLMETQNVGHPERSRLGCFIIDLL